MEMRLEMIIAGNVFSCSGEREAVEKERAEFVRAAGLEPIQAEDPVMQAPVTVGSDFVPHLIGAEFDIVLTNGDNVKFVVTDMNDEWIRVESRNCYGGYIPMTKMEGHLNDMLLLLPDYVKNRIIRTPRKHLDKNGEEYTEDALLFLPAASEVFPEEMCNGDIGLYQQLDWYKIPQNRIRCLRDGDGVTNWYWTSSRRAGYATYFAYVYVSGYASHNGASATHIGAPVCFRISRI